MNVAGIIRPEIAIAIIRSRFTFDYYSNNCFRRGKRLAIHYPYLLILSNFDDQSLEDSNIQSLLIDTRLDVLRSEIAIDCTPRKYLCHLSIKYD